MNDRQLRWAGSLAALMQAAAAAKAAAAAAEQEAVAAAAAAAARLAAITGHRLPAGSPPGRLHVAAAAVGGSTLTSGDAAAPTSPFSPAAAAAARPQTKALGVFGRVWDFLIDEAHYVEAAEGVRGWHAVGCCLWAALLVLSCTLRRVQTSTFCCCSPRCRPAFWRCL